MNRKVLAALATYGRGVLAAGLTAVLTVFTTTGHFPSNGKEFGALLWAVLIAVLPVVINYLNPNDVRYGRDADPKAAPKADPKAGIPSAAPTAPAIPAQPSVPVGGPVAVTAEAVS